MKNNINKDELKPWTKEEIKYLITNWDTYSGSEFAAYFGRSKNSIPYIIKRIRDTGYNLPKKSKNNLIAGRVQEALKELGLA